MPEAAQKPPDLHSIGGFAPDSVLRRWWSDVAVATRGPQFSPCVTAEDYGRVLFGGETRVMPMR
ncbi:hypothetical protein ACIRU3_34755 [Streptomyces sp. NPDC101151]|uniref:hypothetical protein n=1 Tax=Streptomyces sp. NPDC101151 TaxID=3366115 RepID=UPI0037F211C5